MRVAETCDGISVRGREKGRGRSGIQDRGWKWKWKCDGKKAMGRTIAALRFSVAMSEGIVLGFFSAGKRSG